MKILMYLQGLSIGGTEFTGITFASALRDRGHEVILFSCPGPLASVLEARKLAFVEYELPNKRPSLRLAHTLHRLAAAERVDVVHAVGAAALAREAFFGPHLMGGVPLVVSSYAMFPSDNLPRSVPLVIGRQEELERIQGARSGSVAVIQAPIEVRGGADGSRFLRDNGLDDGAATLVIVARLADIYVRSLHAAIDAVGILARERPVRLVVVGDGGARPAVEAAARRVNTELGKRAVVLVGSLIDPEPAYAAADVVLGTATSVLRGMGFGKPAIVLGLNGGSKIVEPSSLPYFKRHGFFVLDDPGGAALSSQIEMLLDDHDRGRANGELARQIVAEWRSPGTAAQALENVYAAALDKGFKRGQIYGEAASMVISALRWRLLGALRVRPRG